MKKISKKKITEQYIFTFGYGNRKDYELFAEYLKSYNVKYVIDVRQNPRAWCRKWYGEQIKIFCESQDIQYISRPELGNTSGNENWIPPDDQQSEKALKEVAQLAKSNNILLICAEMNYQRCHRTEVANMLGNLTSLSVINLT